MVNKSFSVCYCNFFQNRIRPHVTIEDTKELRKEYYKKKQEYSSQYDKEYRTLNNEKFNNIAKEYRIENKETIFGKISNQ
jgi:hypothetical protein